MRKRKIKDAADSYRDYLNELGIMPSCEVEKIADKPNEPALRRIAARDLMESIGRESAAGVSLGVYRAGASGH